MAGLNIKQENIHRINPKATIFYKTAWSSALFTPTFQYFYTDISAISVTFRNSARQARNLRKSASIPVCSPATKSEGKVFMNGCFQMLSPSSSS